MKYPPKLLRYFYILGAILIFFILYGLTIPSTEKFMTGGAEEESSDVEAKQVPTNLHTRSQMMGVQSDNPYALKADGSNSNEPQDRLMAGYGADGIQEQPVQSNGVNSNMGQIPKIPDYGNDSIKNPLAKKISKSSALGKDYPYNDGNGSDKVLLPGEFNPENVDPNKSHLVVEVPEQVNCESHGDCNIVYGKGKNKCIGGQCKCISGTGTFCHKRPDYYKKLCEMSPAQIIKFKKHGHLEKMTISDYVKWLSLFRYDVKSLPREHLRNFQRYMQGLPIYDIPLTDPTEEFFSSQAARKDRVCLDIPNSEIDSPLNYKINSQLNNTGNMNVRGDTQFPLNWSRYYNHKPLNKNRYERTDGLTMKDWFLNNINWLFYDIDRNAAYKDPNQNRFMNVIDQQANQKGIKSGYTSERLSNQQSALSPNQENVIVPASRVSQYASSLDPNPVDLRTGISSDASRFIPISQA